MSTDMSRNILFFEELDSTNLRARKEAAKGAAHGTVIVADRQTAGRGRRGRSWDSPGGVNLYFTIILRPEFDREKTSMLTLVMAYAVAEGIKRTLGGRVSDSEGPEIKWPNDLVVKGRKACGILTELVLEAGSSPYVIIGCGINVGKQSFRQELMETATTLEDAFGRQLSREKLLFEILAAFEKEYKGFVRQGSLRKLRTAYNAILVNRDREVRVLEPKGEYRGIARGINDSGELMVETPSGEIRRVYAGEVSVRGIYGYAD